MHQFYTVSFLNNNTENVTLLLDGRFVLNNSVITFNDIEDSSSNGLFCITNYTNCCRGRDGFVGGQWYSPSGSTFLQHSSNLYMVRGPSKSVLRSGFRNQNPPTGLYQCEIPLNRNLQSSLYVGIYPPNEGMIKNNIF